MQAVKLTVAVPFALLLSIALAPRAGATAVTYPINANGAAEVTAGGTPNQGDPDGMAIGTLTLDNGTGSGNTGFAVLNLTVSNINGTFSGNHIHNAPATTTGSIVLDFGNPTAFLTGTPMSGTISGTVNNLSATTITNVFNSPTQFYYNMHTSPDFPAGAVRQQLPEPGALSILALGGLALLRRRRGHSAAHARD